VLRCLDGSQGATDDGHARLTTNSVPALNRSRYLR
jgi:hypothetical protein